MIDFFRISNSHLTCIKNTHRCSLAFFESLLIVPYKGPSTLATLFNHMWPRIVADPSTLGRHVAATCMLCMQTLCLWRDEPQPVPHLSHKLQCARQSLKIMVSYGNKNPRHNARPHVVEQSGQCARALIVIVGPLVINNNNCSHQILYNTSVKNGKKGHLPALYLRLGNCSPVFETSAEKRFDGNK